MKSKLGLDTPSWLIMIGRSGEELTYHTLINIYIYMKMIMIFRVAFAMSLGPRQHVVERLL